MTMASCASRGVAIVFTVGAAALAASSAARAEGDFTVLVPHYPLSLLVKVDGRKGLPVTSLELDSNYSFYAGASRDLLIADQESMGLARLAPSGMELERISSAPLSRMWVTAVSPDLRHAILIEWPSDQGVQRLIPAEIAPDGAVSIGSPQERVQGMGYVTFDPSGQFILARSATEASGIAAYKLDPKKQSLSPVAGSPFLSGFFESFLFGPGARTVYGGLAVYDPDAPGTEPNVWTELVTMAFDPRSGALSATAHPAPRIPGTVSYIQGVSPSGEFLGVTQDSSDSIRLFRRDPATGALAAEPITFTDPDPYGECDRRIFFSPKGEFIGVLGQTELNLFRFLPAQAPPITYLGKIELQAPASEPGEQNCFDAPAVIPVQ
jgi:hypothetical protein